MRRTKKTPACDVLWMKPFFSLQTKQKISREATRANRQRNNQQIFHNRRCRCLRVFFLHGQSQLELNKKKAFLKIHFQNYRLEPCHYSKVLKNRLILRTHQRALFIRKWLQGVMIEAKPSNIYRWGAFMHIMAILLPTRRWHLGGNLYVIDNLLTRFLYGLWFL